MISDPIVISDPAVIYDPAVIPGPVLIREHPDCGSHNNVKSNGKMLRMLKTMPEIC